MRSSDSGAGDPPVLLVREAGAWRVDLVEMEKAFHDVGRNFRRRDEVVSPYWLVLGAETPRTKRSIELTPVELWAEPLASVVARLEGNESPIARRRLAEILLRNVWLPGEALVHWDDALALDPHHTAFAQDFADRAELLGYPLLGAIALAPHGPEQMSRVGELLLLAGEIDSGVQVIRQMQEWRAAIEAARANAEQRPKRSI